MELENIKNICKIHMCKNCPLYDQDCMYCLIEATPIEWDLKDIERRLENYGEEKSTN